MHQHLKSWLAVTVAKLFSPVDIWWLYQTDLTRTLQCQRLCHICSPDNSQPQRPAMVDRTVPGTKRSVPVTLANLLSPAVTDLYASPGWAELLASAADWHWRQENGLRGIIMTKNVTRNDGQSASSTARQLDSWTADTYCTCPCPVAQFGKRTLWAATVCHRFVSQKAAGRAVWAVNMPRLFRLISWEQQKKKQTNCSNI